MAKSRGVAIVQIDESLCKGIEGCKICVEICPESILGPADYFSLRGIHPAVVHDMEKCTGCDLCMLHCPELAVVVQSQRAEARP